MILFRAPTLFDFEGVVLSLSLSLSFPPRSNFPAASFSGAGRKKEASLQMLLLLLRYIELLHQHP